MGLQLLLRNVIWAIAINLKLIVFSIYDLCNGNGNNSKNRGQSYKLQSILCSVDINQKWNLIPRGIIIINYRSEIPGQSTAK